jgi:Do/DeqQ family serine protease
MRSTLSFGIGLAVSVLGLFGATEAPKPVPPAAPQPAPHASPPAPVLRVDASPVGDGRTGLAVSYADVVDPVQQAVVSVYSAKIVRERLPSYFRPLFGDQPRETREEGLGSGVIVTPDGYILTNNHVVAGADEVKVALADDREFRAKVVGTDPKTDVAVLKIAAAGLPSVTLADSDKLRVGDVVFAIGNPLDVGQTVTMGIVSALGRRNLHLLDSVSGYENFIQTDAAINMGNSGGALVDAKGRLIGINSAIISTNSGSVGIGFAIPVNLAASIMRSLVATGTVARGYLGVEANPFTPELAAALGLKDARGMVVARLADGGPAAQAGLKLEDVITAINGRAVTSWEELRLIVAQNPPGTKVRVQYLRDGKPAELDVTLGRLVDDTNELVAGVTVAPVTDGLRDTYRLPDDVGGLVVTAVAGDSPYRSRFHPGMLILEVNRRAADDVDTARAALGRGRNFCLVWDRTGYHFLPFQVP